MSGLRRYRALLARPGVARVVALSVLCRLPMGMTPLAVLLLVRDATGSFATAGLTTGVYAAAVALVAPVRSRAVDRSGRVPVLVTSGVVHPLALLGLLVAVTAGAPLALVVSLALLSGLAFPPVAAVMRALWTTLADDEAARRTAFSLEAVAVESAFVLGPLAVGLALVVGSPGAAVAAAALLVGVGALGLAASPLARAWEPEADAPRGLAGPLAARPLRWLFAVSACVGGAIGAVEVAVPASATADGAPWAAGVLLAVWSASSIAGGLWYGGRDFAGPPAAHYPWLLVSLAVGFALLPLAAGTLSLGLLLVVNGLAIAPMTTCTAALVARSTPPGTVTEAFGWSSAAVFGGVSVGTAAGGALVEASGPVAALALGAASAGLGLLLGVVRRPALPEAAVAA